MILTQKSFIIAKGSLLKKKQPKTLLWVVVCTILAPVMAGAFLDQHKNEIPDILATLMIVSTFFGAPALYFSILEYPITWLFNKNIWTAKPSNGLYVAPDSRPTSVIDEHRTSPRYHYMAGNRYHSSTQSSSDAWYNNPAYSSLSGNIYHRR